MRTITSGQAHFYISWKWEYLRRNNDFKAFFKKESEALRNLWEGHLANPSEELPESIGYMYRYETSEVNGRPELTGDLLLTLRRVFESHYVWIEISETGQALCGPYICGRRFQCENISVEAYKGGGKPSSPQEISAHAVSDSVVVKDYPKGKERETLVTVKLSRPIDEIILDIRHLQTLWGPDALGNALESLVAEHLDATPNVAFRDTGLKRAIGLFLWDFSIELGGRHGSGAEAIREAERRGYLELFTTEPSDQTLSFWRKQTEACIEAAEVLAFT